MLQEKLDAFVAAAERMHLGEYVRFESDRKRRLLDAFWQGVMRGIGAMIGFAVIGTMLLLLLQHIAKVNLPWISDFVAEMIKMVRLRMDG